MVLPTATDESITASYIVCFGDDGADDGDDSDTAVTALSRCSGATARKETVSRDEATTLSRRTGSVPATMSACPRRKRISTLRLAARSESEPLPATGRSLP